MGNWSALDKRNNTDLEKEIAMLIRPTMQMKPLNKCAPGELVRNRQGEFGIVGVFDDGVPALVILGTDNVWYANLHNDETFKQSVLAYGSEYSITVDQVQDFEFGEFDLINKAGVVSISEGDAAMFVNPPGRQWYPIWVRLRDGKVVGEPENRYSVPRFGHWVLAGPDFHQLKPAVYYEYNYSNMKK